MFKLKIVHIIVDLNIGGAETMLFKLLKNVNRSLYDIEVISMMDEGVFGPKIRELGIPVHTLEMKKGFINPFSIRKARFLVKDAHIIQTWMYHADLLGFIIKNRPSKQKLIWGIRHSNLDKNKNKKTLLMIAKLNSFLSKRTDSIISCSENAVKIHKEFGYNSDNMITIPNGFELDKFYKQQDAKKSLTSELDLPVNKPLIVHIGRWSPQKDYPNLIKSIKLIQQKNMEVNFLLCGMGIDKTNKELINLLKENKVEKNIMLIGRREDIPRILSAGDGLVSSSLGEGFSNVIGEAMACETPCIVTDIGDSAYIVGQSGIVVPPQNSELLSKAVLDFLNKTKEEKEEMGKKARERVIEEFEITKVARKFEEQYERLTSKSSVKK